MLIYKLNSRKMIGGLDVKDLPVKGTAAMKEEKSMGSTTIEACPKKW